MVKRDAKMLHMIELATAGPGPGKAMNVAAANSIIFVIFIAPFRRKSYLFFTS
jgi:hypothetical protein